MNARIQAIEYYLPDKVVTNEDLQTQNIDWNVPLLEGKTGILERHITRQDETALDIAYEACKKIIDLNPELKELIDGLILCTQFFDYIMPPNSFFLHRKLGLKDSAFSYTYNLACSGFIYGLAMAKSFISSGMLNNILLVNADTMSKLVHPRDRSTRMLFGDGASACWIRATPLDKGIKDISCFTYSAQADSIMVQAGGCRLKRSAQTALDFVDKTGNVKSKEYMNMDGVETLSFVREEVSDMVRSFMDGNELRYADIDVVLLHQASKIAMNTLIETAGIPADKCFSSISRIGNTSSSSIPIAYKCAEREGIIKPGQKILMVGFGAGFSAGIAVIDT